MSEVTHRLPSHFVSHDGRVLFTPEFTLWANEKFGTLWLAQVFPRAAHVDYQRWTAEDWLRWEKFLRLNAKGGWSVGYRRNSALLFVDPCEAALFILAYDGPRP